MVATVVGGRGKNDFLIHLGRFANETVTAPFFSRDRARVGYTRVQFLLGSWYSSIHKNYK